MTAERAGVGVTVDLTVRVPRDDACALERAVASRIATIDGVRRIESLDLTGMSPQPNAVQTDARVEMAMDLQRPGANRAGRLLETEFGVSVNQVELRSVGQQPCVSDA